jgi:prolyl-tRNA editing enzyme YbaK/EbsC (Cys-tRNA(Pro) deacylase)
MLPVVEIPAATQRFLAAAAAAGLEVDPMVYPDGTKTSQDAAAAIGCPLGAIAKSMVFMIGDEPVIVLMAGDRRVDTAKLATLHGGEARRASLEEVRSHTGFAAGGTPPIGHPEPIATYADVSLRRYDPVWAAGGTPTTVFEIPLDKLIEVTRALWADVSETPGA